MCQNEETKKTILFKVHKLISSDTDAAVAAAADVAASVAAIDANTVKRQRQRQKNQKWQQLQQQHLRLKNKFLDTECNEFCVFAHLFFFTHGCRHVSIQFTDL